MTTLELEMEVAEIKTRLHRVERALRKQTNFVSGDKTLLTAAQAEGLLTDNPFDHVSPSDTPQASNTI
jgi:hypothetical protein